MRQTVAINDNGGEKRQKEFAMNETCMNHALNMPNIGCCPYCRIAELEHDRDGWIRNYEMQEKVVGISQRRVAKLEQKLADEQKAAGYWMEQSCKDHNRAEKAEKELSRYQGAVEVDGVVEFYPGTKIAGVFVHQKMPDEMVGGQVRVLVMSKEVE